eukprot:COSAG01_NODE_1254_length_11042_cov_37.493192_7_plen_865_part_00
MTAPIQCVALIRGDHADTLRPCRARVGNSLLNKMLVRRDLTVELVQEAARLPFAYWEASSDGADNTPLIILCYNDHIQTKEDFAAMLEAVQVAHPTCFRHRSKEGWGPLTYICVSPLVSVEALRHGIEAGQTATDCDDARSSMLTNTEFTNPKCKVNESGKQRLWTNDHFSAEDMKKFCSAYNGESDPDDRQGWDPDFLSKCWLDRRLGTPLRWVLTLRAVDSKHDAKVGLAAEQSVKAGLLTTTEPEFAFDVRLLNGLFRKQFPERFAELCTLKELWDGESCATKNPLSCAIQNGNRELVGTLVDSLVKRQAVSFVRDVQRNIEELFTYKGGELAHLAVKLLEKGGLLFLDPSRFMAPHTEDPMSLHLGDKNYYAQDEDEASDRVEMFVKKVVVQSVPDAYDTSKDDPRSISLEGKGRWEKDRLLGKPVCVESGAHRGKKGVCVGAAVELGKMALSIRWDRGDESVVDDEEDEEDAAGRAGNGNGIEKVFIAGEEQQDNEEVVILNEQSQFWKMFHQEARAECDKLASHSELFWEPVTPVAIALNGAAKRGRHGLLQVLLRSGTPDAFNCEVVQLLVDWKWDRFGREAFLHDAACHVILILAWSLLTMRIARHSQQMFSHLPMRYLLMAVVLCASHGTFLRYFDKYYPMRLHRAKQSHGVEHQTGKGSSRATWCRGICALECNPFQDAWEHVPGMSLLKRLNDRMHGRNPQGETHRQQGSSSARVWFMVLPLYYAIGVLLRIAPIVLSSIMLGGVCGIPVISYPQCMSNWTDSPSFYNPAIEALAMTLLLCILCRNVWRHLQHVYYFFVAEMTSTCKEKASDDGACCGCSWSGFKSGWANWSRGVISAWVRLFCIDLQHSCTV